MPQGTRIARGYIAVEVDEAGARAALRGFVSFAGSAFKAAAATAGVLLGAAAKIGIEFNAMKEQASIAFTTLLGSGDKAAAMLSNLQKFAASTPFEFEGLVDNARQLLGVGVAADKVIPTMTALGNASSALGLNQDAFNRVMLATTQALGKGKLQGEELLQMVEAGIPVWQLMAKATGKTVPELQKMAEQGKLIAADVLPKLFAQMNKDYGGAMAAQSKTLIGLWSSLKDNTKILLSTAMEPLFDELKSGVSILGDLASSDAATAWAEDFAESLKRGISVLKVFGREVESRFGDDLERVVFAAQSRVGELWPTVRDGAREAFGAAGEIADRVIPRLADLFTNASGIIGPALEAVSGVLEAVRDNAAEFGDAISTAITTFSAVAGPALAALGVVLKIVGQGLELLAHLVGDLSGPLGALTGVVLAGVVAWRALASVLAVVGGLWGRVAPSAVATSMAGIARTLDNVALKAGLMTESLTGSANAGTRVAVAGSKVGSALTKVGAALPVVGLAAVGLGLAFEANAQEARDNANAQEALAAALLKGGKAAEQAKAAQDQMRAALDSGKFEQGREFIQGQLDGIDAALKRQVESMNSLERAQQTATRAQNEYLLAVERHGPTSQEAISAEQALKNATIDLTREQTNAAEAAKSHEQGLLDLMNTALGAANADLQLRQSQLGVTEAQQAYTEAVKTHGAASKEAQRASLDLEGQYIAAANAAVAKAQADTAGSSAAIVAAASTKAYATQVLGMATAAGANAPPALQKLVSGLNASELAAAGATVAINAAGDAVYTLPDGKQIVVDVDDKGTVKVKQLQDEMARIKDKTVTLTVLRSGDVRSTGGGTLFKAVGGPFQAGQPFYAGEQGRELIMPTQPGHVFTSAQTRALEGRSGSGVNVENLNIRALSDRFSLDQVAQELRLAGVH